MIQRHRCECVILSNVSFLIVYIIKCTVSYVCCLETKMISAYTSETKKSRRMLQIWTDFRLHCVYSICVSLTGVKKKEKYICKRRLDHIEKT